jgi:hypothetical protein
LKDFLPCLINSLGYCAGRQWFRWSFGHSFGPARVRTYLILSFMRHWRNKQKQLRPHIESPHS